MPLALKPHPSTPCTALTEISVDVQRQGARGLLLRYQARGAMGDILLPARSAPKHTDRLWEHTCFEAFVKAPGQDGYLEINASSSGAWAVWAFEGYRSAMRPVDEFKPPPMNLQTSGHDLTLTVELTLPELTPAKGLTIGLSAVIEQTDATLSYWALAHPPGKPDFHHQDGFTFNLDEAEST